MQQLNRHTANISATPPVKVLQFGGGNFLRGFADWMIQILNEDTEFDGGVILVKCTPGNPYSELKAQDGLYHVTLNGVERGDEKSETRLISCINQIIHCYNQWDEYLNAAKLDSIRFIISNTTEAGIKFVHSDQFDDEPPSSFPAKLTKWLHTRYQHFNGAADKGCIVLPCELIEQNGQRLKACIVQYACLWKLDKGFYEWLENNNTFCDTLVDRIVSGFPTATATDIQESIGYLDQQMVVGEYYHSWIISNGSKAQQELPLKSAGLNVQFVDNLNGYQEMKVKVLNGAHTAMVPVGYLSGCRTVSEALNQTQVATFIESLLRQEVMMTIQLPVDQIESYIKAVLDRFRNPSIEHQLISISLNSTSKYVTRLLPTIKDYQIIANQIPVKIAFALAALIRMYKGDWNNEEIKLKDNATTLKRMTQLWSEFELTKLNEFVHSVLGDDVIWGEDLTELLGLSDAVAEQLWLIETHGMPMALQFVTQFKMDTTA